MHFNVLTIFPDMFDAIRQQGIIARAIKQEIISLDTYQLRDYSMNNYHSVDDTPYGGGAGMVMSVIPIRNGLQHIKQNHPQTTVIYLSPKGVRLSHQLSVELAQKPSLTLLCGRYEGVDQRIIDNDIDIEVSIGDYVISGGELAAMVLIDAVSRHLPKVLGNMDSLQDSFANGLLEYPQYTRPRVIDGQEVPEVLLSGNDKCIDKWRMDEALRLTQEFYKHNDTN